MLITDITGIIADDLTEVNDAALQFHIKGANTQVVLDSSNIQQGIKNIRVWAVSTASRGKTAKEAYNSVQETCEKLSNDLGIEKFFKKIDTYFRGNIAIETLSMLETLNFDAAIILPATPQNNITTVGGYQLIKGIPVERTEIARDIFAPVNESHIPSLLKLEIDKEFADCENQKSNQIGYLELRKVMQGAGPILLKIKELISSGKKIIVADSVSMDDIEQIILAVNKSKLNILPVGTSATAQVLANLIPESKEEQILNKRIPKLPKLIISGSPTHLCNTQIEKLTASEEIENKFAISINMQMLLDGVTEEIVDKVINNLEQKEVVTVHASTLIQDFDGFSDDSLSNEMTKPKLIDKITDYLAELTKQVTLKKDLILITLGGETSVKCCKAMNSLQLQIIDEAAPQIALSLDHKSQWIISKSGYTGNSSTLIEILKYLKNNA